MQNRIKLIEFFKEQGFTNAAEIGVFDGRFSEIICQIIPGIKLLSVDRWQLKTEYPKYKYALAKLTPFPNVTIMRETSMNASLTVPDESLDFVFIDALHSYDAVKEDVREWTKKVRIGGYVSGHDYYVTKTKNRGVIDAVDEYVKDKGYNLQLTDWDKENLVEDDRQPSWYFLKDK